MKNKRRIIFIIITILLTVGIGFALEGLQEMEYAKYLESVVFKFTNPSEFKQPVPSFSVEASTNEKIQAGPSAELEADMYYKNEGIADLPVSGTFPVGTTFQATSNSELGDGTAFRNYDWQLYSYDENYKNLTQNVKEDSTSKVSDKITADKEGYIIMFLNVSDNYVPKHKVSGKPINFQNWGATGNWLNKSKGIESNGILLNGWYYQAIKFKIGSESEMILKEIELVDPDTNKVLESFKRELDPIAPFTKQKVSRTSKDVTEAAILEREKEYEIRAKYQYVDFSEGKFDITKPETMTEEQKSLSTGVDKNVLDVKYAYDSKTFEDGQFDITDISTSKDKPTQALKNLEEANFSWKYKAAKDKKAVKISGFVPKDFPKVKNISNKDDWGTLYARFEKGEDLEISKLTGGSCRAGETIKVYATVKNNGKETHNTDVTLEFLTGNEPSQIKPITLEPGEIKLLEFDVKVPKNIGGKYGFMATINKSKVIGEVDYFNNFKTNYINILEDPFIPDLNCPSETIWTERVVLNPLIPTYAYFTYEATLKSEMEIKDDRELMSSPTKIKLKSGYGFKTNVESNIKVKQISGNYPRPPARSISAPRDSTVVTSWEVVNIMKIGKETILQRDHFSTGTWGGTSYFSTPVNPKSKTGASVIYTDLDLRGNTENPYSHSFKVYVRAALGRYQDNPEQDLCNTLEGEIEIFGDMHEDWKVN